MCNVCLIVCWAVAGSTAWARGQRHQRERNAAARAALCLRHERHVVFGGGVRCDRLAGFPTGHAAANAGPKTSAASPCPASTSTAAEFRVHVPQRDRLQGRFLPQGHVQQRGRVLWGLQGQARVRCGGFRAEQWRVLSEKEHESHGAQPRPNQLPAEVISTASLGLIWVICPGKHQRMGWGLSCSWASRTVPKRT